MNGQFGSRAAAGSLHGWSIQFAREPESDLDLDEVPEESSKTKRTATATKGSAPKGDPPDKPSSKRPLLFVLLLIVGGGLAYLSMDPGALMELLGQGSDSTIPAPPPPARVAKPRPPAAPAPSTAPAQPSTGAVTVPAPAAPAMPQAQPKPTFPGPAALPAQPAPAPAVAAPLFTEGQRVFVAADPAQPAGAVSLSADATGTRPGFSVNPNIPLTVVDGELRNNVWTYAVRTQQGTVGWIDETRLTAKP